MSPTVPTTPTTGEAAPRGTGGKVTKVAAAAVAVVALVLGASQISKSDATTSATGGAAMQQGAQPPGANGAGAPQGGMAPPGMGTEVTGSTLSKLEAAATAKYPGEVEHAQELSDGSYVVHVIQSNGDGEVHVLVSKDFEVTGVRQGGPPAGAAGAPPSSQSAPSTSHHASTQST